MTRWYVSIDGISDEFLGFLGYTLIGENEEFKLYRHYGDDFHLVPKDGSKFIYVDDLNDVLALHAERVIPAPDENDCT